jgi:glycosyltransferase involved in cell wall biosynthesis
MRIGVYWRSFSTLGGAPRVAVNIIDSLARLGHEPVVLTNEYDAKLYPTLLDKEIFSTGRSILSERPAGKIIDAINATFLLTNRIKDLDGLFLTGMYFASALLKALSDAKIVLYVHAPVCIDWTLNPTVRKISKKVERRLYPSADYVLSNSKLTRNTLREHLNIDSDVLYPPVDTDFFAYGNEREADTIVSVCRLHPKKKSELMMESFKKLKGDYRFVLAGAIEEKHVEYKRQLMEAVSLDERVSVLFNPSDEEIRNLYEKATVFWYVYPKEEFGLPVAEAMSCGTPVVALRGGGVNEIVVNNRTGFLVSSEEEFLRRTSFLLNNLDVCRQMGIAARKRTEETFSIDAFGRKMRVILKQVFPKQHTNPSLVEAK